jgi:hypothetical protein
MTREKASRGREIGGEMASMGGRFEVQQVSGEIVVRVTLVLKRFKREQRAELGDWTRESAANNANNLPPYRRCACHSIPFQ